MITAKINYSDGNVEILPFACMDEAREHANAEARKYGMNVMSIEYHTQCSNVSDDRNDPAETYTEQSGEMIDYLHQRGIPVSTFMTALGMWHKISFAEREKLMRRNPSENLMPAMATASSRN